jgi:hypothetical protein
VLAPRIQGELTSAQQREYTSSAPFCVRRFSPGNVVRNPCSKRRTTRCARGRSVVSVVHRYYDPSTDQFLEVDPELAETNQPYVFTNDDPLNATDPLGLKGWYCRGGVSEYYSGDKYGKVGTGRCKTSPAKPTSTPTPTPTPSPTPTSSPTPKPGSNPPPTLTANPAPSAAQTSAVNNYISATQRPWCYASLGIASTGAAGSEIGIVYGANVDDPPAWLVTGFVIVNTFVIITIIKVATKC